MQSEFEITRGDGTRASHLTKSTKLFTRLHHLRFTVFRNVMISFAILVMAAYLGASRAGILLPVY
jgi:hypothetical protein